jgi:hypothetical protein
MRSTKRLIHSLILLSGIFIIFSVNMTYRLVGVMELDAGAKQQSVDPSLLAAPRKVKVKPSDEGHTENVKQESDQTVEKLSSGKKESEMTKESDRAGDTVDKATDRESKTRGRTGEAALEQRQLEKPKEPFKKNEDRPVQVQQPRNVHKLGGSRNQMAAKPVDSRQMSVTLLKMLPRTKFKAQEKVGIMDKEAAAKAEEKEIQSLMKMLMDKKEEAIQKTDLLVSEYVRNQEQLDAKVSPLSVMCLASKQPLFWRTILTTSPSRQ